MTATEVQDDNTIPKGKYTFIGVDIDTTGRRILDEIVHLAAYSPKEQFDQYVIPVMNLNPAARQRHQLRIITIGFFRMLKCTLTNKVIKCKTEVVALKTFLDWLEERKAADTESNGVVLVYYENIKFIPYMLLEALKKYDLVERFSKLVVGFVDGHALADAKYDITKIDELREKAKEQLKEEDKEKNFEGNAMMRARFAYKLLEKMAKDEAQTETETEEINTDLVQGFVHSVNVDINELSDQNKCIDLQHTFRPIFVQFFKTNLYHRYKAVTFRRVLAEKGFDLKKLEDIWNEKKKDGLTEIISNLDEIKEENRTELIDILDSYFDPEKEAIVPASKSNTRHRLYKKGSPRENRRSRNNNNNNNNNNDKSDKKHQSEMNNNNNNESLTTPDSQTRSPRRHRRSRRRFSTKQLNKSLNETTTEIGGNAMPAIIKPTAPEISVA